MSGSGFGAVLHQSIGPIVFFSRAIAAHHAKLPAYECELIGLVKAVCHWRPYLWGRSFMIRTDHFSLKYILDQRLTTILQHMWVSKLFGYDFKVKYRQGKLNTIADALSCCHEEGATLNAISSPLFAAYDMLREELKANVEALQICEQVVDDTVPVGWAEVDGLLLFQGHVFVLNDSSLWPMILEHAHTMGHEGSEKTLHHLRASFYNPHLR
jgi:hypothetical protein